jgi:hypothetical protein
MNCNCLNGIDTNLIVTLAEQAKGQIYSGLYKNYNEATNSIADDYGQEIAQLVLQFLQTNNMPQGVMVTPNQPNKRVLSPSELKQLFIDLKLDINKEENRRQAMQAIAARSDIDFDATLQILNTIPFLNNGNTNTPSTESNSGLFLKALLGFAVGYGIKKIFFSNKKPVKTAFAGVQAKRKVEIVQF